MGLRYLVIPAILFLCAIASASDYCSPLPNDITTSIIHEGNWWNITFVSPSCYICMDNGGGYGDVDCVPCGVLTANFASNTTCGVLNGDGVVGVQYTDTSTNGGDTITGWYWDFIGSNTTEQNPVVVYTVPGVYGVNHSVTGGDGISWKNVTSYYTVRGIGDSCAGISKIYTTGDGDDDSTSMIIIGGFGAVLIAVIIMGIRMFL